MAQSAGNGSPTPSVLAGEEALMDDDEASSDEGAYRTSRWERRRSSVTERLAAIADVGGVNSFRSFARSWQRAASFVEVLPRRPSLVLSTASDQDEAGADELYRGEEQHGADEQGEQYADNDDEDDDDYGDDDGGAIFPAGPHLAQPSVIDSYGSFRSQHFRALGSRPSRSSFSHGSGWTALGPTDEAEDRSGSDGGGALGEEQPLLVREVKQGDGVVLTVEGRSTLPQSVFNAINAIIGVGMLSLPLALQMSGWLVGLLGLTMLAAVTGHTARLLGRCMQLDASVVTYSDLAYLAFGRRARLLVSVLFTLELVAACLALFILFADSLHLLLPRFYGVNVWKCVCAVLVVVLNTMPLRWLSYTSVVGILATFSIVCIVIIDGFIKDRAPGSLRDPVHVNMLPTNWLSLPLAYGLLASPWGAHSVFPSIYRDMRHPAKWNKAVNATFYFSYTLDTCLAVVGILMFGHGINEAITSNILRTSAYPEGLKIAMCICIAVIPLTKIPLNARPLITTVDVVCGLDHSQLRARPASARRRYQRGLVRFSVAAFLLAISILFPAFDSVCAFLGAALCSLISVILPLLFYLRLFARRISVRERTLCWLLVAVFSFLGTVGTVCTFLPKHLVAA